MSKSTDHDAVLVYDGQSVLIDEHAPNRDPLNQASASASRIKAVLRACGGKDVAVRAAVVYPGWYVRKTCRSPKIWVVTENLLPAYLDRDDTRLDEQEIQRFGSALTTYIRSKRDGG